MKRTSTTKTLASADTDDAPPLTQAMLNTASYRVSGRSATKTEWQQASRAQLGKKRISIMLDANVIAHFKSAAGERGYQTLINDALRRAVDGETMVTEMRYALRQELAEYKNK